MQDTSKTYYSQNKLAVRARMKARRELLINSEKYKEEFRNRLLENLNSGSTKYITYKTANKYKIAMNPETLKYYYTGEDQHVKEEPKFNEIHVEPIIDLTGENMYDKEQPEDDKYIIDVSQGITEVSDNVKVLTDIIAQSEEIISKLKGIVGKSKVTQKPEEQVIIAEPLAQQFSDEQRILKLKEKEKKHQYYLSYKEMVDLYRANNNITVQRGRKREVSK